MHPPTTRNITVDFNKPYIYVVPERVKFEIERITYWTKEAE